MPKKSIDSFKIIFQYLAIPDMIQQVMSKHIKQVRRHRSSMTDLNYCIFSYPFRTLTKRGTIFFRLSLKPQSLFPTVRKIKPNTLFLKNRF